MYQIGKSFNGAMRFGQASHIGGDAEIGKQGGEVVQLGQFRTPRLLCRPVNGPCNANHDQQSRSTQMQIASNNAV